MQAKNTSLRSYIRSKKQKTNEIGKDDKNNNNLLFILPKEIVKHILDVLDFDSLKYLRITCKYLYEIVSEFWIPAIKYEKLLTLEKKYPDALLKFSTLFKKISFSEYIPCESYDEIFDSLRNNYASLKYFRFQITAHTYDEFFKILPPNINHISIVSTHNPYRIMSFSNDEFFFNFRLDPEMEVSKIFNNFKNLSSLYLSFGLTFNHYPESESKFPFPFPQTLKKLSMVNFGLWDEFPNSTLPSSLTSLHLSNCKQITDRGFSSLTTLQKLTIDKINVNSIPHLPTSLTKLDITSFKVEKFYDELFFDFPRNINELSLNVRIKRSKVKKICLNLPEKLHKIFIYRSKTILPLNVVTFQPIISNFLQSVHLYYISLYNNDIANNITMNLPKNLQILKLTHCQIDKDVILHFPLGLTGLTIFGSNIKTYNLFDLHLLDCLISLELTQCYEIESNILNNLPKNLKNLKIHSCENINDYGPAFKPENLPPNCDIQYFHL